MGPQHPAEPFVPRALALGLSSLALAVFLAGSWLFAGERHWLGAPGFAPMLAGPWRGSLPSFAHTFAFVLLAAVWLARSWRDALVLGGLFWAVDLVLELLQSPLPHQWLGTPAALRRLLQSTFDPADVVAMSLGLVVAWGVLALARHRAGGPR
jgi:hypothetical protein